MNLNQFTELSKFLSEERENKDMCDGIFYHNGDATEPVGDDDMKLIVHSCNNVGAWGAGFVLALSKKWEEPERVYHEEFANGYLDDGQVMFVPVEEDIVVANMVGQQGVGGRHPVRYDMFRIGFETIAEFCKLVRESGDSISVHMPRIGCGLGGGRWSVVEALIEEYLLPSVSVHVYDFKVIH